MQTGIQFCSEKVLITLYVLQILFGSWVSVKEQHFLQNTLLKLCSEDTSEKCSRARKNWIIKDSVVVKNSRNAIIWRCVVYTGGLHWMCDIMIFWLISFHFDIVV